MTEFDLSRRASMTMGAATFFGASQAAAQATAGSLPLSDPKAMAPIRAKIMGSTVEEPVYTYMR
ncbi:MAG: hypothetical protein FJX59_17770, partial [Alphaproteobacteria bacterium]|nr:hypothetical protein [Alphaproteobacteria bacterium]